VQPASTPEQAAAALAAAPPGDLRLLAPGIADQAALGTVLLRAGRAAEAVPFLERAAHRCDGFLAPVAQVRATAQLGRALEVTGDRAGACAAYQRVLDRWGATARSVTARDARLRATALGCAPGAGVTPSRG
jgi:tetratricopeptide (TPR) repeat protein